MNRNRTVRAPHRTLRRIAAPASGIVLCAALVSAPPHAGASSGGSTLEGLRFPAAGSREFLADRLWLHGMPARVLVFDVPQSPAALARALSAQQPALADLHVLPGQLILSGRVGEERWVAQMEGVGKDRTVGSVSTINVRAAPIAPRPAWLPEGARVRLDVAMMEAGVKVSDRIWQYALPPRQLAESLDAGLRRAGWTPEGGKDISVAGAQPADPGQWWMRERERMKLWLVPFEGGSGLRAVGWAP